MRRYQKARGVSVPSGRRVTLTAEGVAMGYIPDVWNTFLDPDFVRDNKIINRAQPGPDKRGLAQENIDAGTYLFSAFPNGERAISLPDDVLLRSMSSVDINPERWTVFVVQRPNYEQALREVLVGRYNAGEGFSPRMGINASNARASIYKSASDSSLRLGYTPPVNYANRTVLLMFTFSIERGLAIFENGKLGAAAPEDTQPFTTGYSAGEAGWNYGMRGLVGMAGLLDADLSAPENTGFRHSIERFLMSKYGITPV